MRLPSFVVSTLLMGLTGLGPSMVSSQGYPNKPIRIVCAGVGGSGDFVSRQIAQGVSASLGQSLIVDNRASSTIPGEVVSKAPPDGYTLLVHGAAFWIGALLQNTPYDPARDFLPITLVNRAPSVLVVYPPLPVKSVQELIALARAKPGALNYSAGGVGGTSHLVAELFKHTAGVNIVRVPYKSGSVEMAALMGGEVQMTFGSAGTVAPHIKSGKLRALAVTTAEPTALFPDLPTVAASGLPDFEAAQMSGVFAPAKTPAPIINRLNQEIVRFLRSAEAKENFFKAGIEAVGSTPEELAAKMRSEMTRMGKVIKDAGIRAE